MKMSLARNRYWLIVAAMLLLQACYSERAQRSKVPALPEQHDPLEKIFADRRLSVEEIPEYLAIYKQDISDARVYIDGDAYPIAYMEELNDDDISLEILTSEQGVFVYGFIEREATENPTASEDEREIPTVIFYKGVSKEQLERGKGGDSYLSSGLNAEYTKQGRNEIYSGTFINPKTRERVHDFILIVNDNLKLAGSLNVRVSGNKAYLQGGLGTESYIKINDLIVDHPEVTTLVLEDISGSDFDEINMHTGQLVRNARLTTVVPSDGEIFSGGVDLFAAGYERIAEKGAVLGVHSWCCTIDEDKPANRVAKNHPAHQEQLSYFKEMLGGLGEAFYFFTLTTPYEEMHHMSIEEINHYLVTTPIVP